MSAIIYCRVSTKNQSKFGVSLEAQEEACKEECKKKEWKVEKIVTESVSATELKNQKELLKLLPSEILKETKYLVVYSISRFSRNVGQGLDFAKKLLKMNLVLHSVKESVDLSTSAGEYNFVNILNIADLETKQISDRVKAVIDLKKKQGQEFGVAPFGKKAIIVSQKIEGSDNEINVRKFVLNQDEVNVITFVRLARTPKTTLDELNNSLSLITAEALEHPILLDKKTYLLAPLSYDNIAELLNDYNVTKRGKVWSGKSVSSILKNVKFI